MSQDNVEVAKRAMDAYNRRDLSDYNEMFTADYQWVPGMPGAVEGVGFQGREGVEAYFEELLESWEDSRLVVTSLSDLGERVLVDCVVEGRGRRSGIPFAVQQWIVWDFRGGKISATRAYLDHDDALKAVGLEE